MTTTIKTHLEELQTSAARMLVLNSDNKMLISYFKDLNEKLLYLKELINMETKYNWLEVENAMKELQKQDEQLTHITLKFQIKEITEKNEAFLNLKSF